MANMQLNYHTNMIDMFSCDTSGSQFACKRTLEVHACVHNGKKPNKSAACGEDNIEH